MAEIVRKRRLVNPGRRHRNPKRLSALQKLFFGTKRQRAAVKANRSRKRRNSGSTSRARKGFFKKRTHASAVKLAYKTSASQGRRMKRGYTRANPHRRRRRRNVSSIVTVYPVGMNPGRRRASKASQGSRRFRKATGAKKRYYAKSHIERINKRYGFGKNPRRRKGGVTVARRRRRARVNPVRRRRVYRHRRRNYGTQVGRSWSSYKVRGRRRNPSRRRRRVMHHRRHYRRNPGMLGSTMQSILGVMGGVALTKTLCTFVPAQFATGIIGYLATGIIAVGQGKLIGKVLKSPTLGHNFMVGGLAYLTSKILNDFLPALGGYGGIGLIGGNSFYVPQVNQNGSMGSFVLPGAVSGAIGSAMVPATTTTGVRGLRRTGRLM